MNVLPVCIVACALRKSVARPVADPRQWDWKLSEALGKRRERLGQRQEVIRKAQTVHAVATPRKF